jgi:large subunit ribosomal protein L17
MRHRVRGRKLGRTTAHRKALFRNQLTALFTHDRIVTTLAKAKELRPLAERMVTLAGTGSLPARRKVLTMVPDKEVVRRLFEEIAPRFTDRPGGYTRVMRLGRRRGDGAELAIIEFVDYELSEHEEGGAPGKKGSLMDRAKGVFGGGAKKDADEVGEEMATAEDEAEETVEAAAEEAEPKTAEAEEPAEEPEAPVEDAPAEEPEEAKAEEPAEEPEADAESSEPEEEKKDS